MTRTLERAATLLFVLALIPSEATPHGGEDHGDQPLTQAPPNPFEPILLAKESQFLLGVTTEVVAERDLVDRIVAFGPVSPRADRWAELYAPQPGRVAVGPDGRLPMVGQPVSEGQVLAVIEASLSTSEQTDIDSQRIAARAHAAQARSALAQAERDLERLQALEGVVADRELQAAQVAVEFAREEERRARRELALLDPSTGEGEPPGLFQFPIVSPLDGVVAEVHLSVGEQIDPSHQLFAVFDPSEVWVTARVYSGDIGRIRSDASARIWVEAYPEREFTGALLTVEPVVSAETRTVGVVFAVANPDRLLLPGMFAHVEIAASAPSHVLAVPDAAVQHGQGRDLVFLHVDPEHFVAREVALGRRDGSYWEVTGGLSAGDRVVMVGAHQLRSLMGL